MCSPATAAPGRVDGNPPGTSLRAEGGGGHPHMFCPASSLIAIDRRLGQADPAEKNLCFLVLSGSFNPVHTQHTALLRAVKHHCDRMGWLVLAGFLAPSSAEHVRNKVGARALSLTERISLCRLAAADLDWAHVCAEGEQSSKWVTRRIRAELEGGCRDSLNGRRLTGIEIMGSDTLVRLFDDVFAKTSANVRDGDEDGRVVCYLERRATTTLSIGDLERDLVPRAHRVRLIRVEPAAGFDPETPVSSTAILELVAKSRWNELSASGWLHPAVLEAL